MPAALIAVVAVALVAATGLSVATVLLRSPAEVVLATFVLGFAEVVALVLVLSPLGAVRREALVAAMVMVFAAAGAFWWRSGRPLPSVDLSRLRGSPPLVVLGIVVAGTLAYVVALVIGTAPNTWDSLVYHLARAAFWRQEGGAGYIEDAYDGRLNANPPNGELALTFVLELARDERLAGFVQLFAALACAVAVLALARRIGLSAREAAFGSLLFLTLPIVVLQSSTTQNDLVVAAMLLAATVFVAAESRWTLTLCGLAVALAMGTKVTAVFALPVLCAVALLSPPKAARAARIATLGVGALAGSYWYVVNLVETGRFLGRRPDTELLALGDLEENVLAAFARVLDAFDLSGAEG
ncbi:MAG: glycosyltransferase family 39 protein, partial [Gaiellaceae bacterium]